MFATQEYCFGTRAIHDPQPCLAAAASSFAYPLACFPVSRSSQHVAVGHPHCPVTARDPFCTRTDDWPEFVREHVRFEAWPKQIIRRTDRPTATLEARAIASLRRHCLWSPPHPSPWSPAAATPAAAEAVVSCPSDALTKSCTAAAQVSRLVRPSLDRARRLSRFRRVHSPRVVATVRIRGWSDHRGVHCMATTCYLSVDTRFTAPAVDGRRQE